MFGWVVVVATVASVNAVWLAADRWGGVDSVRAAAPRTLAAAHERLQAPVRSAAPMRAAAAPRVVSLPRLGIRSRLQPLGLQPDGTLESPSHWQEAGWYSRGVRPGDVGPALIAGHIDSVNGPAVFYRLPSARVGDAVTVTDARGVTRHFTVVSVVQYPKAAFPSRAVYGPTAVPTIRLVTCYGAFDQTTLSYVNNLVVTAVEGSPSRR